MNSYASLRKKNKHSRLFAVVSLALCVVLSASLLCSRLMVYSPAVTRQNIPLTRSNGITHVTVVGGESADGFFFQPQLLAATPGQRLTANPGFRAYDKNTTWAGETEIDIFRISYDGETGETVVSSQSGDKVLAPGTGNTYEFALENTGNVSLDYTLTMEAYFSHTETPIPIFARVLDHKGNYLLDSEGAMVDVLRLNEVDESGVLSAGYIAPYTLEWEWPFELDDEYDTMLGNMAVEEDITLTIVIKTMASYSEDPQKPGGIPQTGDTTEVALLAGLMVASMAGILLILLLWRKEDMHEKA